VSERCFFVAMLVFHSSSYQKSTARNYSKLKEDKCISSYNSLTALLVQVSLCFHNADRHVVRIPACISVYDISYKEWNASDITAVQFLTLLDFHIFF